MIGVSLYIHSIWGAIYTLMAPRMALYRVGYLFVDFGWIDFVFGSSIVYQILLGEMRIRQY